MLVGVRETLLALQLSAGVSKRSQNAIISDICEWLCFIRCSLSFVVKSSEPPLGLNNFQMTVDILCSGAVRILHSDSLDKDNFLYQETWEDVYQ